MTLLNRKLLLKRDDFKIEKVNLDEENYVYVRQMSGHERDAFERSLLKEVTTKDGGVDYQRSLGDFRAKLAVNTICDEKGNLILGMEDYLTLSKNMAADKLEKIINVVQRLNAITNEEKEQLVKK